MLIRTVVVLVVMAGCAPRTTIAVLPTPGMEQPTPTTPRVEISSTRTYGLLWSQDAVATPGCFYFSGPPLEHNEVVTPLGVGVELRRVDGRLYVSIDGVTFSGDATSGPTLVELSRSFASGEKWHVVESLQLDSGEAPRFGTYRYRECPESQGRDCESACSIMSTFSLID